MIDRKPDTPDINKIKCEDCRYSVDNVNEERPKMRFCAISDHALDIMDKGLPIWGCPIKDAYMQKIEKEGKMVVDVYVKWSKDEAFNHYHVTKGNIYKLAWILHRAKEYNIIEEFYIGVTF